MSLARGERNGQPKENEPRRSGGARARADDMWLGKQKVARARSLGRSIDALAATAEPVLATHLGAILEMLGFDRALAYLPQPAEGGFRLEFAHFAGRFEPSRHRALLGGLLSRAGREPFSYYDPLRPQLSQRNSVAGLAELRRSRRKPSRAMAASFAGAGFGAEEQLRVLICAGEELLAWVGGYREQPFTRHDHEALQALVQPLRRRLLLERRLALRLHRAGLEAALEAMGSPAYLVQPGGQILHANQAGRAELERGGSEREAVRHAARHAEGDPSFDMLPVRADGLVTHHLLLRRQAAPGSLAQQLSRATSRWGVTRQQQRVLELLAEGEANKQMAERLGCSVATIEVHVTALLQKASVDSRARLIAVFWRLG